MILFSKKKFTLVIVCSANVTRSAFFEGLLRKRLEELPGKPGKKLNIISAGVYADTGCQADLVVSLVARQHGFPLSKHRSRKFNSDLAKKADLVLVMERRHKEHLLDQYPIELHDKIYLITEYGGDYQNAPDIPDPTGQDVEHYETFIRIINKEADHIIEELMRENILNS